MPDARMPVPAAASDAALTRTELLARWNAARHRRDDAPLDSEARRAATIEVGEIEVEINALDVQRAEGRDVQPAHRGGVHHP